MTQPSNNPEITLVLDLNRVNQIMMFLGKQPFEVVADLIVDIRNQAGTQIQLAQQQQNVAQQRLRQDAGD
jgi:GAF domain-containing protein